MQVHYTILRFYTISLLHHSTFLVVNSPDTFGKNHFLRSSFAISPSRIIWSVYFLFSRHFHLFAWLIKHFEIKILQETCQKLFFLWRVWELFDGLETCWRMTFDLKRFDTFMSKIYVEGSSWIFCSDDILFFYYEFLGCHYFFARVHLFNLFV